MKVPLVRKLRFKIGFILNRKMDNGTNLLQLLQDPSSILSFQEIHQHPAPEESNPAIEWTSGLDSEIDSLGVFPPPGGNSTLPFCPVLGPDGENIVLD